MDCELERELYEIDPVFFRQKDLDMTKTCMCWGIECGNGWFKPIRSFVEKVRILNAMLQPLNQCIVATQIKSKWADFTCYWNMDILDDGNDMELDESQESMVSTVYGMMDDAVRGCEEECSHTCEICGKHSIWDDEVFACGSWLTVKCVDCAQERQRKSGKITDFKEGFMFLSPFAREAVVVDGVKYPTVIGAFYGVLHPGMQGVFTSLDSPSAVQTVAVELGLCRDDDATLEAMRKVLEARYSDEKKREMLLGTDGIEIVQLNRSHENAWGSCWCDNCKGMGRNQYGKLLMEIRDSLKGEKAQ